MAENGAIVARAPASHVATGEWQSFELRMRRRRAERCLLRAEIALEAGYPEDAREALDEARRLAPGVGGLADLEGRIAAACVTEPSSPQSSRVLPIAIAALFAIVVFVTTFVIVRSGLARDASARTTTSDPVAVSRGVPALVSLAPRAAEEALSTPAVSQVVDEYTISAPLMREPPRAEGSAGRTSDVQSVRTQTPDADRASIVMEPIAPPSIPAVPVESAIDAIVKQAGTAAERDELIVPVALPSSPPIANTAPPPVAAPAMSDEAAVCTVLARYAAAYDRLDAPAAQAVWPSVDAVALTRAFEGLAEQHVTLSACTVDVRGSSARASCTGSARWAPKVGDGAVRTERRAWTFDLSRTGTGWQIESARVR